MRFEGQPQKKNFLIARLRQLTGMVPEYTSAPEFSFKIGAYKVLRNGALEIADEKCDRDIVSTLVSEGYIVDPSPQTEKSSDLSREKSTEPVLETKTEFKSDSITKQGETLNRDKSVAEKPEVSDSEASLVEELPMEDETPMVDKSPVVDEPPISDKPSIVDELQKDGHIKISTSDDWTKEAWTRPIVITDSSMSIQTMLNLVNLIYSKGEILSKVVSVPDAFWVSEGVVIDMPYERPESYKELMMLLITKEGKTRIRGIQFEPHKVTFSGFPETDKLMIRQSYEALAVTIYNYVNRAKFVCAKKQPIESERYVFKNWVSHIGMNGPENRKCRSILSMNLKGNSSYRTKAQADAFKLRRREEQKNKKVTLDEINGAVRMAKQMKMNVPQIIDYLVETYSLSEDMAAVYVNNN